MASILDEYKLTVDKFEAVISHGMNMQQVLTIFRMSDREMNEWCMQNYNGHDFKYVYEFVRQMALDAFFETCQELGYRGNPSALAIINNAIQRLDSGNTIKIQFVNSGVSQENEEDKLNDEN